MIIIIVINHIISIYCQYINHMWTVYYQPMVGRYTNQFYFMSYKSQGRSTCRPRWPQQFLGRREPGRWSWTLRSRLWGWSPSSSDPAEIVDRRSTHKNDEHTGTHTHTHCVIYIYYHIRCNHMHTCVKHM
jgi:hypothetical protein